MDWTGGARKRFAAGKDNSSLTKQKQHFAKVRAAASKTTGSQRGFTPDLLWPSIATSSQAAKGRYNGQPENGTTAGPTGSDGVRHHFAGSHLASKTSYSGGDLSNPVGKSRVSQMSKAVSPGYRALVLQEQQARPGSGSVSAEERLLLARRRRLLERGDWLGLSAARPLLYDFQSDRDKDRIGKHRKVDKTIHKAKPAGQRNLTPLFEDRLARPEYVMSGGLPNQEYQIKIGTEALASQTQPSRRSRTPANTSMRQLSTEFESLTEESMLLGEDGDGFEEYAAVGLASAAFNGQERTADTLILRTPSRAWPAAQTKMDRFHNFTAMPFGDANVLALSNQQLQVDGQEQLVMHSGLTIEHATATSASYRSIEPNHHGSFASERSARPPSTGKRKAPQSSSSSDSAGSQAANLRAPEGPTCAARSSNETDQMWRKLMHIPQHSSSHASVAALKSSSQHVTDSSSSHRPLLPDQAAQAGEGNVPSTPKGAGTQDVLISTQGARLIMAKSSVLTSPSPSLKEITRLAALPLHSHERHAAEDELENELWREFIIGSDDSSVQPPFQQLFRETEQSDEPRDAAVPAQSLTTSGLGTSVSATQGTIRCEPALATTAGVRWRSPTSEATQHVAGRAHVDPALSSSADATNVHHPSQWNEDGGRNEHDSIEHAKIDPRRKRQTNLQASAQAVRVQPYRQHKAEGKLKSSRRRATRKSFDGSRGESESMEKSIYDLPVSDGASF